MTDTALKESLNNKDVVKSRMGNNLAKMNDAIWKRKLEEVEYKKELRSYNSAEIRSEYHTYTNEEQVRARKLIQSYGMEL